MFDRVLTTYFRPVASLLMLLAFITFTLFARGGLSGATLDLTENRLFTVSKATRTALSELAEPIELTLVYSSNVGQDYPAIRAYADRVRQYLRSYGNLAGGQLDIRELNSTPFSEAEDEALAAGLTAVETDGPDPLYFGLIGRNAVDDELVIPFLAPERETTLEYDLTRMIVRLDRPVPATIGILSSLPGMSDPRPELAYQVRKDIEKSFEIEQLAEDFVEIPGSVDILLIAHPPRLTEFQTYLIDQFLLSKGRAIILVDPASKAGFAAASLGEADNAIRSDLPALFARYGVELSDAAVGDTANALPVSIRDEAGRQSILGQPLFIDIGTDLLDRTDPVTAVLNRGINFGAPGKLSARTVDGLEVMQLAQTSDRPSFIPPELAARNATPDEVLAAYSPEAEPAGLILRIRGILPGAFPSGPVSPPVTGDPVRDTLAADAASRLPEHLARGTGRADLILVADADLLDDSLYIDPGSNTAVADNASFVLNAIDSLSGSIDLASLRSRAPADRAMTRIIELREAAEADYFQQQASLESELQAATQRIEELQEIGATGGFFSGDLEADLTPEERQELVELRATLVDTREQLRSIQRRYRQQLDGLERRLSLANIYGPPALIGLFGFIVLWRRHRRMRRVA